MGVHAAGHAILRRRLHDPGHLSDNPALPADWCGIVALGYWREANPRRMFRGSSPSSESALALLPAQQALLPVDLHRRAAARVFWPFDRLQGRSYAVGERDSAEP